jgi:hypothetical protein
MGEGLRLAPSFIVMPAKAGIQSISLDPRFRGGDEIFEIRESGAAPAWGARLTKP